MYEKRSIQPDPIDPVLHPLKSLTAAEFAALGGNAVAFVRAIKGAELDILVEDVDFEPQETYQLVMSADGTPLLVADSQDAVVDWLEGKDLGLVSVH